MKSSSRRSVGNGKPHQATVRAETYPLTIIAMSQSISQSLLEFAGEFSAPVNFVTMTKNRAGSVV